MSDISAEEVVRVDRIHESLDYAVRAFPGGFSQYGVEFTAAEVRDWPRVLGGKL